METSDVQQQQPKKQNSPSSSPEAAEAGFVMVPPSLAGDSSKHKTNQVTREEQKMGHCYTLKHQRNHFQPYLRSQIELSGSGCVAVDSSQDRSPTWVFAWGLQGSQYRAHPGKILVFSEDIRSVLQNLDIIFHRSWGG